MFPLLLLAAGLQLAPPDPPRVEVTAQAGWLGVSSPDIQSWNDRIDTGAATLAGGFFVTPNLKLEFGAGWSGAPRVYANEIPYSIRTVRSTTLAPAVSYQFSENRWVHPFVTAGAHVIRETEEIDVPRQATLPPSFRTERSTRVTAFAGGGVNFYVAPRAFVRTELQLAPERDGLRTRWTTGIGVNF